MDAAPLLAPEWAEDSEALTEGLLRIQDKIMREKWLVKNNQVTDRELAG